MTEREEFEQWCETHDLPNSTAMYEAWQDVCSTAPTTGSAPHIPAIKGAWIDGGYVIVTPTGTGNAPALKAAILALSSAPASPAASVPDLVLTIEELDALTKKHFSHMHPMYLNGFRRMMRSAIKSNAEKHVALLAASMGGDRK